MKGGKRTHVDWLRPCDLPLLVRDRGQGPLRRRAGSSVRHSGRAATALQGEKNARARWGRSRGVQVSIPELATGTNGADAEDSLWIVSQFGLLKHVDEADTDKNNIIGGSIVQEYAEVRYPLPRCVICHRIVRDETGARHSKRTATATCGQHGWPQEMESTACSQ